MSDPKGGEIRNGIIVTRSLNLSVYNLDSIFIQQL